MAFIDDLKIELIAGTGGNGVVRWRREKYIPHGGPAGGNGGRGGDVIIKGIRNNTYLNKYQGIKSLQANHGAPGGSKSLEGKDGANLEICVPIGTMVTNLDTNQKFEILSEDEAIVVLRGGKGGVGNEALKTAVNQAPKNATLGKIGQRANFRFNLELIADVGLIGLPNAGKSTLINFITESKSKVADYPFTTLEPHLGIFNSYTIADIPGIIEGASEGKGLGIKFLQHITRTSLLLHCISLESSWEELMNNYQIIRKELESYSPLLINKPEQIIFTKSDLVDEVIINKVINKFPHAWVISVLSPDFQTKFSKKLSKLIYKFKHHPDKLINSK